MPAKKKKGKGSKLARMTDEERLRYLQHRAELELEAKRRKQELIAVFTKNKLKREEAFARLNTAKINEQWRFILRRIKCKELYEAVDYLWKNFDKTTRAKDALIGKLYAELETVDLENMRLQESHVKTIDRLIGRHLEWLGVMRAGYDLAIRENRNGEMKRLQSVIGSAAKEREYLETVIVAEAIRARDALTETRTRNAVNIRAIEYRKEEDVSLLRERTGGRIEDLWMRLDCVITEYDSSSAEKRKQYEYLKQQDNGTRLETARFDRLHSSLMRNINALKENYYELMNERYARIDELNGQAKRSNEDMCKARQELRIHRTMDAVRLKRTSVTSVAVINELQVIEEKGSALLLLIKMCSKLEPTALAVKKYEIHCADTMEETNSPRVTSPYGKMDKFWEQYNYVKADNMEMKSNLEQLMLENGRLRQILRSYLINVSKTPVSKLQAPMSECNAVSCPSLKKA